jgi:hypothetical protein
MKSWPFRQSPVSQAGRGSWLPQSRRRRRAQCARPDMVACRPGIAVYCPVYPPESPRSHPALSEVVDSRRCCPWRAGHAPGLFLGSSATTSPPISLRETGDRRPLEPYVSPRGTRRPCLQTCVQASVPWLWTSSQGEVSPPLSVALMRLTAPVRTVFHGFQAHSCCGIAIVPGGPDRVPPRLPPRMRRWRWSFSW